MFDKYIVTHKVVFVKSGNFQILIYRGAMAAKTVESFRSSLFQKAWLSRRARRSPSAEGETPYRSKAPRGVNFGVDERGGPSVGSASPTAK